jgi:MFS transporter, PPP family, 3-phenylpropionic acid transporter
MPHSKFQLSWRLAGFYGIYFVLIGFVSAFWPLWLKDRGITETDIGIILASGIFAKVFVSPSIAHLADRRGDRKRLMIILAFCAAAVFSTFQYADGFWGIFLVTVMFFMAWSTILPLGESLTMLNARAHGLDYGQLRLWGSVGFIVATMGGGLALTGRSVDTIFWLILTSAVAVFAVCWLLPNTITEKSDKGKAPLWTMLSDGKFVLFIAACALIQATHSIYYGFGTIHWKNVGYDEMTIGALWAEGVLAEIVLFIYGTKLIAKLGPSRLILLGSLAAIIRWTITGLSDELSVLIVVQVLHAFTFGATHLGAIHYISNNVTPSQSATAQSLYAVAVSGVGMAIGLAVSGKLYAIFSGGAYLIMAGIGLVGFVLALIVDRNSKRL